MLKLRVKGSRLNNQHIENRVLNAQITPLPAYWFLLVLTGQHRLTHDREGVAVLCYTSPGIGTIAKFIR
jgi:hypothetical protein